MANISDKQGYLARGEAVSPTSEGPEEPVLNNTQILTSAKLTQIQSASAAITRFAATAWSQGGLDPENEGRLYTGLEVSPGAGSTFDLAVSTDGTEYDANASLIAGHVPARIADGDVNAAPAASFLLDVANIDVTDISFEDDGGSEYNVGVAISVVPSRSDQNPRSGLFEFTQETAILAVVATPTSVSYDSGLDQLTLVFSDDKLLGNASSLAGRAAMAWKVIPLADTATALATGTVTFVATNRLVVSGAFGQVPASVSTTPADYRIAVLGPAVWVSGVAELTIDGVAHIAYGRSTGGGSWDNDGRLQFPTMHLLLQKFLRMTVPSDSGADLVSSPKLDIAPNDNEPGSSPQLQVWGDAARTLLRFEVLKDGGFTISGPGSIVEQGFPSLEAFIDATVDTDVGLVNSFDPTFADGQSTINEEIPAAAAEVLSVAGDGRYIVVATDDAGTFAVTLRERFSPLAIVRTFTLTAVGGGVTSIERVVTNGSVVAVAYNVSGPVDGILELFDRDTGVSLVSLSHSGVVSDCAIDVGRAYVCGATAGAEVQSILLAGPFTTNSFQHGAAVNSITTCSSRVYIGGVASAAGPSDGAHIRALSSSLSIAWSQVTQLVPNKQNMICDGIDLYVSGATVLELRQAINGTLRDNVTGLATVPDNLALDYRFLLFTQGNVLNVFDRRKALSVEFSNVILDHTVAINGVFTDGDRWFMGGAVAGGVNMRGIIRFYNLPRRWRRVVATDSILPFRQLALPTDT